MPISLAPLSHVPCTTYLYHSLVYWTRHCDPFPFPLYPLSFLFLLPASMALIHYPLISCSFAVLPIWLRMVVVLSSFHYTLHSPILVFIALLLLDIHCFLSPASIAHHSVTISSFLYSLYYIPMWLRLALNLFCTLLIASSQYTSATILILYHYSFISLTGMGPI